MPPQRPRSSAVRSPPRTARSRDRMGKPSFTFGELTKGKKLMKVIAAAVATAPASQVDRRGHVHPESGWPRLCHRRAPVRLRHAPARHALRQGAAPPAFQAKLVSVDTKAAEALPGVKVVHQGDFVGVVGPTEQAADTALALVKAEWKTPPQIAARDLFKHLKESRGGGGGRRIRPRWRRCSGFHRRGAQGGRQDREGDLHDRLHRPCAARTACRGRRVEGRQGDGLDRHAAAVPRSRRGSARHLAWGKTRSA